MRSPVAPSDPLRVRRLVAAAVAAVTIVCLLALVVIVARDQVAGSAVAVQGGGADAGSQRAALEAHLDRDPHDDGAVAALADLATAERRWADAAAQWARLARLDPLHPDARFEQARALLAVADVDGATAALTADGREPTGREQALLARAALLRGDLAGAQAAAGAATAAAPDLPVVRLLQADLAFLAGDDALAQERYAALADDPDTASAAGLGLAQLAIRAGERDAALARLAAVPDSAGFQVLHARAALYRQLGRSAEAMADYVALVDTYGPLPDVLVPLAELHAADGAAAEVGALRQSLSGSGAADLAARHYLQAIEAYLSGDAAAARDYLGWAADFFAGRDLYRWMQLDVGAELGDAALVATALDALDGRVLSPLRRARAAAVLAARAADFADQGDADTAGALAQAALALVPDLASARLVAARAALLRGDQARATALAESILDDDEHRTAALEVLGRAALRADRPALAAERFAALAAAAPEAAAGPYWQGVIAARAGELGTAEEHLRLALARRTDPRIESALLQVLIQRQDWPEAMALADEVATAGDARTRARGEALRGDVLRAQDDLPAAAAAYAAAAAADPARAAYALSAADLYMMLERWDAARAVLATAAGRHADNRYVAFKRALLAQRSGAAAEAERRYRALLDQTPDWALPMVNLAELLATDPEALALAERAARLAPEWPAAQWNLAQRRADAGDSEGALAAARSVLALSPEHTGALAMAQRLGGSG
jgi:tetratricopeptide (TPR) repeat protein